MKIMFLDFETTGMADFNKRARDPEQPHIVQAAALTFETDTFELVDSFCDLAKPDGWSIPPEATEVHGITNEFATLMGMPEQELASAVLDRMRSASLLVAHNLQFDKFIARIACRRYDLITDDDDAWWKAFPTFCTMRSMTDVCRLPGKFGGRFKWPSMSESYQHCFGIPLTGGHDAMTDVKACASVYFWLLRRDGKPAPEHIPL